MTIPLPKLTALHALFEHGARFKDHPMCHDGQRLVHWSEFVALVSARSIGVKTDALGEVLVQHLQRGAVRALGVELVLRALLVPPMNVGIRPVGGRAH